MENKKNKNQIKSFYIPLLLILVVIAGIVAFTTTVKEAKEASQNVGADKEDTVPVVARPSVETEMEDTEAVPETEDNKDAAVTPDMTEPESEEEAAAEEPAVPTFIAPTGGIITKGFSDTVPVFSETMNDYRVHTGVDVSAEVGEAVLAASDGTIGAIWDDPLMGKCMTVVHPGEFVSTYKGLGEILPDGIAQGVAVTSGQPIAAVGESAIIEIAEEPHVHFELTCSGVPVDPCEYVSFSAVDTYEE